MRRVIEYIASDFRKDKFWLRRVEPSKRQYQVMVAVDDSASMVFNHSKQVLSSCGAVIFENFTSSPFHRALFMSVADFLAAFHTVFLLINFCLFLFVSYLLVNFYFDIMLTVIYFLNSH